MVDDLYRSFSLIESLPGGAEVRPHESLGDREHVTDLVHLHGFGAVSGANEGTSISAKYRQTISNSPFYTYLMQKNSSKLKKY